MKKNTATSEGILVESVSLMARVQACVKRAQGLLQDGREAESAQLDNAADSVVGSE